MTIPQICLGNWFAARAARSADRRALTFEGQTLTYRQLLDRVDRLAAGFRKQGVRHGDRIGFIGPNQPAVLETMLAAARLGAIFVPFNFRLTGPELALIANDAGLHTFAVDQGNQAAVESVRGQLPVQSYVLIGGEAAGWKSYESLVDHDSPLRAPEPVDADDVAVIMYTSGTTGRPKGVMLTHANLWWNNINLVNLFDVLADDVTLVSSPLFHIAGLNVTIFTTWQKGGEVVLHRSFDAQTTLDDIQRYRISVLFGAPTMFQAISQLPGFDLADMSSVRTIICGGAPVPEVLMKKFHERGFAMLNGYGLTETAPHAAFLTAEYIQSKPGSVGQPSLLSEIKIIDPNGATITEPFVSGEICARGPNVTKGYWNQPEATAEAIDESGWFHTGDVGYLDADEFLYLVDRIKDMVVSGGENVSSVEVEGVLHEHPAVTDVAIIGAPHERWGETVVAVIVPAAGQTVTLEELRDFAGHSLARFKLPTQLILVDDLPRNPAGKILKVQLRDEYRTVATGR
ncbi:MAG TPA: long-chain fatty acid--CoA ligase [Streptosporangiaceae bacterium]|nr:long-chain fatty acid--CoA ligase [Streptosporangiaceae bacterium]